MNHRWVEQIGEPVSTLVENGVVVAQGKLYKCEICGLKHEIGASIYYLSSLGRFRGNINKVLPEKCKGLEK